MELAGSVQVRPVHPFAEAPAKRKLGSLPEWNLADLYSAFDPAFLLNPDKAIPTLNRCAEFGKMHVHQGNLQHPELPRF